MTEEQRAELEKLARAATPGPWTVEPNEWGDGTNLPAQLNLRVNGSRWGKVVDAIHIGDEDSAFIAAANPATVLDLLATIARLEAEAVKDGEALANLVGHFENGDTHDEGAFDEACPDCVALSAARARLSSRAKDQSQ